MNINEKLIYSNTVDSQLDKEVNKMYCLKILNLISSFLIIPLFIYIMIIFIFVAISQNLAIYIEFFALIILFAILNLFISVAFFAFIINLFGTISNSFWIKTNDSKIDKCCCYVCCCCININCLKYFYLLFAILMFLWDGTFIFINIEMFNKYNMEKYIILNAIKKALLGFCIVLLLLFQSYCFFYYNKFLNRLQIYLEYYKKLIVRGEEKKAQKVRKLLGTIHEKKEESESGQELRDIKN